MDSPTEIFNIPISVVTIPYQNQDVNVPNFAFIPEDEITNEFLQFLNEWNEWEAPDEDEDEQQENDTDNQ
jgi:hypothetical protein